MLIWTPDVMEIFLIQIKSRMHEWDVVEVNNGSMEVVNKAGWKVQFVLRQRHCQGQHPVSNFAVQTVKLVNKPYSRLALRGIVKAYLGHYLR